MNAHGIGGYDKDGQFCMIAESDTRRGARQQYTRRARERRQYRVRVRWYAIRDGTALEMGPYTPERRR